MSIFYFGAILVLILELISYVHGHNSSSCYHPEKVPAQAQKNDTPMIVSAYYPVSEVVPKRSLSFLKDSFD
jgi:hypothetical protein